MAAKDLPITTAERHWWNSDWLAGLLLLVATILAYQQAWTAGYIWDDDVYVTRNALLVAPDGLKRIWFSLDSPSQYFPLTYTTFRIERALWGLNPTGYHCVNIVLHAVNALLVWRLLKRLTVPGAWFAAAIFALHPVNVESVAWITELKNVQSLFFFLLALLAWVKFIDASGEDSKTKAGWYVATLLCHLLALFSKTTACTLPAALLLILWLQHKPITRSRWLQVLPFVALGLAMGLVSMWWERFQQGTEGKAFGLSLLDRILIASRAIWFYLGKLIWPANLTFNYPRWEIHPANALAYVWLIALSALAVLIWKVRRFAGRSIEAAMVFYAATLAPMLGFVMLYTFHYTFVADHYQYVAMIGPAALAAAGGSAVWRRMGGRQLPVSMLAGGLLAVLAVLTWKQCGMYADAETLWRETIRRNPDSFMAHNNLGDLLLKQGRLDEAQAAFEQTLKTRPDSAQARSNLGTVFAERGQTEAAIREYRKALELEPGSAVFHKNLAAVLLQAGQFDQAADHCRKAIQTQPSFAEAHQILGSALLQNMRLDEAIVSLQRALALQPDYPNALNNLGIAQVQKGNVDEAMTAFEKAVELNPNFAEGHNNLAKLLVPKGAVQRAVNHYRASLNLEPNDPGTLSNLGWVLATWPEVSIRDAAQALKLAERANALSGGRDPGVLCTLAAAYAENRRFQEAVSVMEHALREIAPLNDAALTGLMEAQLKLYRADLPYRDMKRTGGPLIAAHP